jgi:hypothetical protein
MIKFKVSFDSLDDPEAISLMGGSDYVIMDLDKRIIMNSIEGLSLGLDPNDFDDEDSVSYFLS